MATAKTNEVPAIITAAEKELNLRLKKSGIDVSEIVALTEATKDIKVTDNDSYELAKVEKRKFAKFRTGGTAIYKEARQGYIDAQKWVIGKEKEFTDIVAEGENPLASEIDGYEAKLKAEQDEKDAAQARRLNDRNNQLAKLGVLYTEDGNRVLDDLTYDKHMIETCEDETFAEILASFQEKYNEIEAVEAEKRRKELLGATRRNTLSDVWNFLSEETRNADLSTFTEDEFGAIMSIGVAEKQKADKEKEQLQELKAKLDMQIHAMRSEYLVSLGFEIGEHAVIGFGKQYPLTILDNDSYSTEQFETSKSVIKLVIDEYNQEQENKAALELIMTNRKNDLFNLGFRANGSFLEYETINFGLDAIKNIEHWDNFVQQQIFAIEELKEAKIKAKLAEDAEAEASMSDSAKWKLFLAELDKVTVPTAKSKKFTKFTSAEKLINQIKSL